VLQAKLLQHGLFFLLGPHDVLRGQCLCCAHDLLRSTAVVLHGFGLVLLGTGRFLLRSGCNLLCSAGKLLHASRHLLLGSGGKLLRSIGLVGPVEELK